MPVKKTTTTKKITKSVKPKTKSVTKKIVPKNENVKTVKPTGKSVATKEAAKKKSVKNTKSNATSTTKKTTKLESNLVTRKKSVKSATPKSKLTAKKTTKSNSKQKTEKVIKVPRKKREPKPKKRFAEIVNVQPSYMNYLNGNIVKILPSSTDTMYKCEVQLPGYTGLILSFNPIELKEITDDFTTKEMKGKIELTIKTHEETKHE